MPRLVSPLTEHEEDLAYELKKCKECSCSRCQLNSTRGCYIEVAIRKLNHYEQAMDSIEKEKE